jgi:hypothetical protein
MIPTMLFLINRLGLHWLSLLPGGIYLIFLLRYYPRISRRLMKPFFWSQLLIMTLMAGFFWNPENEQFLNGGKGFLVGLEMSMRAVLIVSAFSAISVEIRNPAITRRVLGLGWSGLYASLSLAFNALPAMLDRSGKLKSFIINPFRAFSRMIAEAREWLECYQKYLES